MSINWDRFSSREDPREWIQSAWDQGYEARMSDFDQKSQNFHEQGSWAWRSFNAGWCDADMDPDAPWNVLKRKEGDDEQ